MLNVRTTLLFLLLKLLKRKTTTTRLKFNIKNIPLLESFCRIYPLTKICYILRKPAYFDWKLTTLIKSPKCDVTTGHILKNLDNPDLKLRNILQSDF